MSTNGPECCTRSAEGASSPVVGYGRSEALAEEVARIIGSPYPVPLLVSCSHAPRRVRAKGKRKLNVALRDRQKLHEILTSGSDDENDYDATAAVTAWSTTHPCQIDALAECVLEALTMWPYVLDIVAKLGMFDY